jgi:O-antigen ligase
MELAKNLLKDNKTILILSVFIISAIILGFLVDHDGELLFLSPIIGFTIIYLFFFKKYISYFLIIFLNLVPFVFPLANIESPFTPGKTADIPFYEMIAPLLGLSVFFTFLAKKDKLASSPLNIPLLFWFLLIFINYFRNPLFLQDLRGDRATGLLYRVFYFSLLDIIFYFSTISILKSKEQIKQVFRMIFIVTIITMLLNFIRLFLVFDIPGLNDQATGWDITRQSTLFGYLARIRILGFIGLSCFLFLLCFRSLNFPKSIRFMLYTISILAIVLSGERAPFISMIIALLVFFLIKRKIAKMLSLAFIALTILVSSSLFMHDLPLVAKRTFAFSLAEDSIDAGSLAGRLNLWRTVLNVALESPIVGIGFGREWEYIPYTMDPELRNVVGNPHNDYLDIFMHLGIIGLLFYLSLCVVSLKTAWSIYKKIQDKFLKEVILWIILSLIGLYARFFTGAGYQAPFLYFILGIITVVYNASAKYPPKT